MKKTADQIKLEIAQKEREIEVKKQELLVVEQMEGDIIKRLSEFTDEEKIQKFDYFYGRAMSELNSSDVDNDDNKQYLWEEIMELIAKDKKTFWKYYNKLH